MSQRQLKAVMFTDLVGFSAWMQSVEVMTSLATTSTSRRIEPLASAGGICITAPVHASIRSQINTPSYPMGEPILRFIPSGE